jgi:outer membrane protein assembly factor BamB
VDIYSGLILSLCSTNSCNTAKAADWPQYLGPNSNSTSPEKGILRSWSEGGPEVLWTVAVGRGFGGPVIKDSKVYLLDRDDEVGDTMRCFDLSNGKELWKYGYEAPGTVMFPGSRSLPVVDDNNVYSCGHNGDVYCIDIDTHKPVWNKNVWTDFGGGSLPRWAITQCPLIYGDLLIVASQAPQASVVAYDKLTGDVEWKTPSLGPVGYVSPAIVKIDGADQLVMISASEGGSSGGVTGINPKNSEVLWNYPDFKCIIPVPSAFDAGEDRVLIIGPYNAGAVMLKIEPQEDGSFKVNELFKTGEFGAHTKAPLLVDGYFYAQYTTNERRDGLVCMSMDGKIMWKTQRSPSFDKGSMILVDGLILATDGNRSLYMIEPNPSEFKPIATAELLEQGQNWGPMALSDGKLLIRDQGQMKCVKVAE